MLNYINDNFLHAPSTDLSKDVVQFLVKIMLGQATEAVFEKCIQEKKLGNALLAKIAAQAASMYVALSEEVKEFFGKGVFDRNWVTVIQVQRVHFSCDLADLCCCKDQSKVFYFTHALPSRISG
jgi:hypothetical protein